ncbi:hypothetical protein QUB67_22020 [Microcoleus sp. ARI1-A1]
MCEFVFAWNEKRSHLSTKVRSSIYDLMRAIFIGLNTRQRKIDCVVTFYSAINGFTGASYRLSARGGSESFGGMGRSRKQIDRQFGNV